MDEDAEISLIILHLRNIRTRHTYNSGQQELHAIVMV